MSTATAGTHHPYMMTGPLRVVTAPPPQFALRSDCYVWQMGVGAEYSITSRDLAFGRRC